MTEFAEKIAANSAVECSYCADFNQIADRLLAEAEAGDIILTVGAGNITDLSDLIVKKN